MILTLFRIEALKVRRSLALWMMAACPFMVVLLNTGVLLKNRGFDAAKPELWQGFWMGNVAIWCYFMLPLFIALCTALVNGNEHRNRGWRLMLTLPINHRQLYLSKLMLVGCLVAGANACMLLLCFAVNVTFSLFGHSLQAALAFPMAWLIVKLTIASLPVLVLQHAVAWRYANFVLPLGIGVCATMGIIQLGSSEYWRFFPWTYPLMAANGSASSMQATALTLALILGLPLLAVSSYWLGKREIAD
jgi:hypothetical protein